MASPNSTIILILLIMNELSGKMGKSNFTKVASAYCKISAQV